MMITIDNTFLLARVENTHVALPAQQILHIGDLPHLTRVPNTPPAVSGVMNLRGNVIPVADIRTFFGLPSLHNEVYGFRDMLERRREDHLLWINELERCVKENEPFNKARSAHDCEFGKWYDNFETSNKTLELLIKRFEEPHKAVHELADIVLKMSENGNMEEALKTIELARETHLARLNGVFDTVIEHYLEANKELVVIIKCDPYRIGFIVDAVNSVEHFDESQIESVKGVDLESHIADYSEKIYKKGDDLHYGIIPEKIIPAILGVIEGVGMDGEF